MKLSARVLGQHAVTELTARARSSVLVIGSDSFHRSDLADVACFNFIAAQRLSAAIASLGVASTRDLFEHVPPSALVIPHVGAIALAVLGAAFERKKLGGEQPLEAWVLKHAAAGAKRPIVTIDTLKAREHKRESGETNARKARRARKGARRDEAQRRRVTRFHLRRDKSAHA